MGRRRWLTASRSLLALAGWSALFVGCSAGDNNEGAVTVPTGDSSPPSLTIQAFVGAGADVEAASVSRSGGQMTVRLTGDDRLRIVARAMDPESGVEQVRVRITYSVSCIDAVSAIGISLPDNGQEERVGSAVPRVHAAGDVMPAKKEAVLRTTAVGMGEACQASPGHPYTFDSADATVVAHAYNSRGGESSASGLRVTYSPEVRVANYNINLGGKLDPQLVAAETRLESADIAFVQEIDDRQWLFGGHENEPAELAARAGFTDYAWAVATPFNSGTVWGTRGNAILSRYPLTRERSYYLTALGTHWYTEGVPFPRMAIVTANAEIKGRTYLLIASHFPDGRDQDRLSAASFVRDLMESFDGPSIFGADVNGTDLDLTGTSIVNAYDAAPRALDTPDPTTGGCDVHLGGSGNEQIYLRGALRVTSFEKRCSTPAVSDHPFVLGRFG